MKHNLKVGQTLYLRPIGNEARRNKEIREAKIKEIGANISILKDFTPGLDLS